jgi:catechol 2,3-dioxygenase-like lactoylglutathione lyase family enzyme
MHMIRLDHATINTADLAASVAFYGHYLGLKPGWRPHFDVGGAWLYPERGEYAIVHLIEKEGVPKGGMFDHVAFRGKGLREYLGKLKATGDWYKATPVPETPLVQVHHYDPNQVLIEVNFENEPLDPSDAAS